jgi:hypothetical protein
MTPSVTVERISSRPLLVAGLLPRLGGSARLHVEVQLTLHGVDVQAVARVDLPAENEPRELVLHQSLDCTPKRTRAELAVVALAREQLDRVVAELDLDLLRPQPPCQPVEQQSGDLVDLLLGQGAEDDDLVDAVDELRAEAPAQDLHQIGLQVVERLLAARVLLDPVGAEVRGHDHDGVLEVDRAALGVGQPAVVEDLEQDVEDVRMRFLDLVEEEHRVRPPPDLLGQLACLVVADVSRRSADETRDGVPLLELAHVEANHQVLGAEQDLCERTRELRLADARRPEEEEAADRPVRVAEPGA